MVSEISFTNVMLNISVGCLLYIYKNNQNFFFLVGLNRFDTAEVSSNIDQYNSQMDLTHRIVNLTYEKYTQQ